MIEIAWTLVQGAFKAVDGAQKAGWLGGSTEWINYATDLAAITANFVAFAQMKQADPEQYDKIEKMPPDQRDAEIRRRIYLEGWDAKVARIDREIGPA